MRNFYLLFAFSDVIMGVQQEKNKLYTNKKPSRVMNSAAFVLLAEA